MENVAWYECADKVAQSIRPTGIYAYNDCLRGWAREPFTRSDLAYLRQQCSDLYAPAPCRRRWHRDPSEQQYFDLKQPTDAALHYLGDRGDHISNYSEFALDWNFAEEEESEHAKSFLNQFLVKRWHRASQGIRFVEGETRYTAAQQAATNLVSYADRPSRITGEPCVHIEFRVRGQRRLERLGIRSAKDFVSFDHHGFWKQRLLLRTIDVERFGRLYNRQVLGRGPRYGAWGN
jgi:hypothetical protein